MKNTIKRVLFLLCVMTITAITMSCNSYERKMAKYAIMADEFKATLDPSNQILAEIIDSIAQKIFYIEPDNEGRDDKRIKNIKMHDYALNETRSILPEFGAIEGFEFYDVVYGKTKEVFGVKYLDSKLIKDRLFLIIESPIWSTESTGIFYINIRDNSLHYVESCDEAYFHGKDNIIILRLITLSEGWGDENDSFEEKQYTLSTSLSDEDYLVYRNKQRNEEKRIAEEWRNRDIEKTIEFDYTVYSDSKFEDHRGTLNKPLVYNMVHTKVITIPNNKVWVYEYFTTSGYGFHAPVLGYHKVRNGYCDNPYGPPVKYGQVFYPGQYMFSIKDLDCNSHPGHRKATIVFTEKVKKY